ncbi:hypothetical protein ACFVAJ_18615 [Agromyces sp. NPDC057679]|uniref:hypothetical protein n=1 Tax=Agromyces sp. NPDC057679 TaxID=3346207 RepID=UPI00366B128A
MASMNIWMVWAKEDGIDSVAWLVGAFDDDMTSSNRSGWDELVESARKSNGRDNTHFVSTSIDFDVVTEAFNTTPADTSDVTLEGFEVWTIWAKEDGGVWIQDAWDSGSALENIEEWEATLAKAVDGYGADNVRVVKVELDYDALLETFSPPKLIAGRVSVSMT